MVFADAATHTIAANQAVPEAKQPPGLGFANSADEWGGVRWSTFVWQMMPSDKPARGRLMLHELFHRIQPGIALLIGDGQNDHLDTAGGRYWMQLEWRALAKALSSSDSERAGAIRDALAFRHARRKLFPGSADTERRMEINEGLAQYTGTVASLDSSAQAAADCVHQLAAAPKNASFIRTFPYASGAAYGILLDRWSPGWTRRIKNTDDLAELLAGAAHLDATEDPEAAATTYGGAELKIAEAKRESEQKARVAELRRQFVEGPILSIPGGRSFTFATDGMTAIPGAGTIYPSFRATGEWGSLEASKVLVSSDRTSLTVPAPANPDGATLHGEDWTLQLAPGWIVSGGSRKGDFQAVRDSVARPPK